MPSCFARSRTAMSMSSDNRRLTDFSFGFSSNEKRIGLNCEKSRSERSCSRKASASSSDLKSGTLRTGLSVFCFIALDLLAVHVACAQRAQKGQSVAFPHREDDEYAAASTV